MTRKQKNLLTILVIGFNAELKECELPTYTFKSDKYDYNSYTMEIYYKVFNSIDFERLVKFKEEHHLSLYLGSGGGQKPYIHIN